MQHSSAREPQGKCDGSQQRKSLKDCVRHFTPAWFAVTMGTGAISILWHNYPYDGSSTVFKLFAAIFFFLNLAFFLTFNVLTIARYALFPEIWDIMIRHPVQSMYLGCYPMGATTLINVAVGLIYQQYGFGGRPFLYVLWAIWWADVVLSFLCAFVLVFIMMTRQDHALNRLTAVWLLPVVTFIVASSTGGVLAPALLKYSRYHALITLTVSAFLVTVGLTLAMMILFAYFIRLIVYGVPQGGNVISTFIPLGPTGQGGYSILLLGQGFRSILPLEHHSQVLGSSNTGDIINVICVCIGFVLWSISTMWLLYALLGVQDVLRHGHIPFKLPVWGLIFPNGVYANLTIQLYTELNIRPLRVWGAIYAVVTLALWLFVFTHTVLLLRDGAIFESPCIEEIDLAQHPHARQAHAAQGGRADAHPGAAERRAASWTSARVS